MFRSIGSVLGVSAFGAILSNWLAVNLPHYLPAAAAGAISPGSRQTLDRLVTARREGLAELLSDWSPEQHEELAGLLSRLARVSDVAAASLDRWSCGSWGR